MNLKIIFIRHGEPNYTPCDERGFIGQGRELAPLSDKGIFQAETVSKDPILHDAKLIISSPYTRALQTAAIISKNTGINLVVETDLHEYILDKAFKNKGAIEAEKIHSDFNNHQGIKSECNKYNWESVDEIINRVIPTLEKYLIYDKVIVVAHGGILRRFINHVDIKYCDPYEITFHKNFCCNKWV